MIRTTLHVTVNCDACGYTLGVNPNLPAGRSGPAGFPDRITALTALDDAVSNAGWAHRAGLLLCPRCAGRSECLMSGKSSHSTTVPAADPSIGLPGWEARVSS